MSNINPVPQPLAKVTSSTTNNPVPPPIAEIMSSAEWSESLTTSDESENNSDKGPSAIKRKCKTRGELQHKHQVRTRGGIRTRGAANILDNNIVDNSVRKCRGRGQPTVCSQIRSKQQQGGRYNRGGQKKHGDCCQGGPRNNQPVPLVWKPINKSTNQILEDIPMFEQEGFWIRMRQGATELDYVELNLTDQIIGNIVTTETNRHAECFLTSAQQKRNNSFLGRWEPVTTNEIKTFLGVLLLMGIVYKPKMRMYLSKDALYSTRIFSEVMSRNRFELIVNFFHFNDNSI